MAEKGARVTGADREALAGEMAERYSRGDSIRDIAADHGRSYGFVHRILSEAGVPLRGRGGAQRGKAARKTSLTLVQGGKAGAA